MEQNCVPRNNRPFPRYGWLNAKVDCTYQSLVFNVISIDYVLIRYTHGNRLIAKGRPDATQGKVDVFGRPKCLGKKTFSEQAWRHQGLIKKIFFLAAGKTLWLNVQPPYFSVSSTQLNTYNLPNYAKKSRRGKFWLKEDWILKSSLSYLKEHLK